MKTATAIVRLIVEVDCAAWGQDATIVQATRQAQTSALDQLQILLQSKPNIRVVSASTVEVRFRTENIK